MSFRVALGTAALVGLPTLAHTEPCRLALVLALDVSASVDRVEDRLQREGLARALLEPGVRAAFLEGDPVALHVFEWSAPHAQTPLLPEWQVVASEDDLARIARTIAASQRSRRPWGVSSTATGEALAYASAALARAPSCQARTVDVATDGASNVGRDPAVVYGTASFGGVTVNALIVSDPQPDRELIAWVDSRLLLGPMAFRVLADGYEDYERAMTEKLLRELEQALVSGEAQDADAG